jgi:bifunctional non-homologous end joining protein LigD
MKKLPRIAPLTLRRLREPFDHPDWVFELKHDGFRGVAYISDSSCRIVSRRDNTFKSFTPLRDTLGRLRVKDAILDGEIIFLDGDGVSIFNQLMFRQGVPYFYAFDVTWLNGRDLRSLPLIKRKDSGQRAERFRANVMPCPRFRGTHDHEWCLML